MSLYHFEIGFPKGLITKFGVIEVTYKRHALNAAETDRYGRIDLPRTINTDTAKAIEVEVINRQVVKIVYRTKYNDDFDLILVLSRDASVRTVWLNSVNDKHKTLDRNKYDKP